MGAEASACRQYGAALHVTPFSGPVGGGDWDTVTYRECDGTEYDGTAMAYNWTSFNTSVATLSNRYLDLVGAGSTTTQADIDLVTSRCLPYTDHPQQSVTAKPVITGPNTVWWFNGFTPSGYQTEIALKSSGGSGTIWAVVAGAEKVTTTANGNTLYVRSSGSSFCSSVGDIQVTAQANFQTSDPFRLTARKPYRLTQPQSIMECDAGYGYRTQITYIAEDQLQTQMAAGIDYNEKWTTPPSNTYPGTTWARPVETGGVDPGPYLKDIITGPGLVNGNFCHIGALAGNHDLKFALRVPVGNHGFEGHESCPFLGTHLKFEIPGALRDD